MNGVLIGIWQGNHGLQVWKSTPFKGEWELKDNGMTCYNDLQNVNGFFQFNGLVAQYSRNCKYDEDDDVIYVATEYKDAWVNSEGKICWDYKQGKHLYLFNSTFELADYSFIKNMTGKDVTIKCRNGVFALPSGETMVAELNKCLNNKKNAEKYGIVKLERGETSRTTTVTTEWCPYCEEEVEIPSTGMTQCKCGKWIIPCSMCDMDNADCENCISAKIAEERNEPKVGF